MYIDRYIHTTALCYYAISHSLASLTQYQYIMYYGGWRNIFCLWSGSLRQAVWPRVTKCHQVLHTASDSNEHSLGPYCQISQNRLNYSHNFPLLKHHCNKVWVKESGVTERAYWYLLLVLITVTILQQLVLSFNVQSWKIVMRCVKEMLSH